MQTGELVFELTRALKNMLELVKEAELKGFEIPVNKVEDVSAAHWFAELGRVKSLANNFSMGDANGIARNA
jgi:hypothetical protein